MTKLDQLDLTKINSLLESRSYIRAYKELQNEAQLQKPQKSSVEKRAKEWRDALASMDVDKLLAMQETMSNYVDLIAKHELDFAAPPKDLSEEQKVRMMRSSLMTKEVKEFLEVYYNWVRSTVFGVITEAKEAEGVEDADFAKGEIEVKSLGKRFCKEGGGRRDPVLDEEKLQELLGKEEWEGCLETEVIPAQEVTVFSVEKLMQLAESNPSVLEKIRVCLKPGDFKSNSFMIRDIA